MNCTHEKVHVSHIYNCKILLLYYYMCLYWQSNKLQYNSEFYTNIKHTPNELHT